MVNLRKKILEEYKRRKDKEDNKKFEESTGKNLDEIEAKIRKKLRQRTDVDMSGEIPKVFTENIYDRIAAGKKPTKFQRGEAVKMPTPPQKEEFIGGLAGKALKSKPVQNVLDIIPGYYPTYESEYSKKTEKGGVGERFSKDVVVKGYPTRKAAEAFKMGANVKTTGELGMSPEQVQKLEEKGIDFSKRTPYMQAYGIVTKPTAEQMRYWQRMKEIQQEVKELPEDHKESFFKNRRDALTRSGINMLSAFGSAWESMGHQLNMRGMVERGATLSDKFSKQLARHPEWLRPEGEEYEKSPGYYSDIILETLPSIAGGFIASAAGFAAGGPAGAVAGGLGYAGALEGGIAYREAKNAGATSNEATQISNIVGGINGILEFIPILRLLNKIAIGKQFKRKVWGRLVRSILRSDKKLNILKMGAGQSVTESITEALQELTLNAVLKTVDEDRKLFSGTIEALIGGGGAGFLTGGAVGTSVGMPQMKEEILRRYQEETKRQVESKTQRPEIRGFERANLPIEQTTFEDYEGLDNKIIESLDILNLKPPKPSIDEIKVAYRRLATKYHPDMPTGDTQMMQKINNAYDTLVKNYSKIEGAKLKEGKKRGLPKGQTKTPSISAPPQAGFVMPTKQQTRKVNEIRNKILNKEKELTRLKNKKKPTRETAQAVRRVSNEIDQLNRQLNNLSLAPQKGIGPTTTPRTTTYKKSPTVIQQKIQSEFRKEQQQKKEKPKDIWNKVQKQKSAPQNIKDYIKKTKSVPKQKAYKRALQKKAETKKKKSKSYADYVKEYEQRKAKEAKKPVNKIKLEMEDKQKTLQRQGADLSTREKRILEMSRGYEDNTGRVSKSAIIKKARKEKGEQEYKNQLLAMKKSGKDENFFRKLYQQEFDNYTKDSSGLDKSSIIFDFIENQYGFARIKDIIDPIKAVENVLNKSVSNILTWSYNQFNEVAKETIQATIPEKQRILMGHTIDYVIDNTAGKLIHEYKTPEAYSEFKEKMAKSQRITGDLGREMANWLNKDLTNEELIKLQGAIINHGVHSNPKIEKRATLARHLIDQVSERIYKAGGISFETYAKNKGTYLARLYYSHELKDTLNNWFKRGAIKAELRRTMKRGITKVVSETNLQSWLNQGWEKHGKHGKGFVKIWRDYTTEERKTMREILNNPGYVVGRTLAEVGYDAAILEFFQDVASHPEWVSDEPIGNFKRLPNDEKYGALKGKWADPYIYDDIKGVREAQDIGKKLATKLLSEWKRFKVVDNPSTWFRNMYFNFILSDIAGLSPYRLDVYGAAFNDYIKKKQDYKDAYYEGIFGTDWVGNELQTLIKEKGLNLKHNEEKDTYEFDMENVLGGILDVWNSLGKAYKGTQGFLSKGYQAIDHVNKMALYKFAKYELEMSKKDAAKYAKKWGLDYSAISPSLNKFTKALYGHPFLRFYAKAAPRLAEAIVHRPFTVAKWMAISWFIEEELRKKLTKFTRPALNTIKQKYFPDWMKNGLYIFSGVGESKKGKPLYYFMDMTYIIPFVSDFKNPSAYDYFYANPLARIPVEIMANRVLFTQKELVDKELYPEVSRQIPFFAQHIYSQIMPSMMPGNYNFNKLWNAIWKKPGPQGRINEVLPTLAATVFGLRFRPIELTAEQNKRIKDYQRKYHKVLNKINNIFEDRSLTEKERKEKLDYFMNLAREYMKKASEVQLPAQFNDIKGFLNEETTDENKKIPYPFEGVMK